MLPTSENARAIALVTRRLEILERRVRRQRALCFAVGLAAGLAFMIRGPGIAGPVRAGDEPAEPPQLIKTRQVILVDEDGKQRVLLSGLKQMPGIFVKDAEEKQRAALALLDEGPAMYLCDPDGTKRIYCDSGSSPVLGIADAGGVPRAVLGLFNGKPALNLYPLSNRPAGKP